ncbi:Vitamin B12-binding protein [Candidatus Calditenuaceae archaeon HR02]|nr:Vitamin B12-binding protein [Candidatus Calditenuaceae archaeon HR02]
MRVYNPYVGWVEHPDRPSRIVSLCPSVTETLFMLGVGGRVVGVSSWCHRPREALERPKVGSYTEIVRDKIMGLEPELVFTTVGAQRRVLEELLALGYPTYPVPLPKDVYAILSMVVEVGGMVGEPENALRLADRLAGRLDELRALGSGGEAPRVYVEIDLGGPTVPAYFNHINSAFHLAGIANIFGDSPREYLYGMSVGDYPVLDVVGELVKRDPDVIIYESKSFHPSPDEGLRMMKMRGLERLRAVKTGNVLTLPADTLAHYGPSFLEEAVKVCDRVWDMFVRRS